MCAPRTGASDPGGQVSTAPQPFPKPSPHLPPYSFENVKSHQVKTSPVAPGPLAPKGVRKRETHSNTMPPKTIPIMFWSILVGPSMNARSPEGKDILPCRLRHERPPKIEDDSTRKKEICVYVACARACADRGSSEPFFCTPYSSNTQVTCRILAGESGHSRGPIRGPEQYSRC